MMTLVPACATSGSRSGRASSPPRTRPEATSYRETSRYADVRNFIDSLALLQLPLAVGSIGKTTEGRDIPYIIASRPGVSTPAAAKSLSRPIVYVQGNIHGGEIEGKDALLALVRDLAMAPRPNALDSIVLIAVPIYNADGNDKFAPQARNRTDQNGPALVGVRANSQNLDLNRDYVKAEAPETRASLAMFNAWDPDVFVDLHTTNGSYHGYALTYSPSLAPAAVFGGPYARDSMLPLLRERMRARHRMEVFDYGNFLTDERAVPDSTVKEGWATYDARPRFGTNYYGLRGRIAILSEAYSHDPLPRRIASTYAFVSEILSLVAEQSASIRSLSARASAQPLAWGRSADSVQLVAVRSELVATPQMVDVIRETIENTGDSTLHEPGMRRGRRRTGRFTPVRMPVFLSFTSSLDRIPPAAYVIPPRDTAAVRLLRLHGIRVERSDSAWSARGEAFTVDSIIKAARPFQGHRETRLRGRWSDRTLQAFPAGSFIVSTAQPLGTLVVYLLEPESEDGLVTWNFFDASLKKGEKYPVRKVLDMSRRGRGRVRRSSTTSFPVTIRNQ